MTITTETFKEEIIKRLKDGTPFTCKYFKGSFEPLSVDEIGNSINVQCTTIHTTWVEDWPLDIIIDRFKIGDYQF